MKKIILFLTIICMTSVVFAIDVEMQMQQISGAIFLWGKIYNESTGLGIQGIDVQGYCTHNSTDYLIFGSEITNSQGAYGKWSILQGFPCEIGDTAWIKFYYNGQWYYGDTPIESLHYPSGTEFGNAEINVGVPEFSATTLAIAVIIGVLGLIVIRKH